MHYEIGVGVKPEFIDSVRDFIEHTMTLGIFKNNELVRCPCSACRCLTLHTNKCSLTNEISECKMISLFVNTWGNEVIYTEFSIWLTNYFQTEEVSRNKKTNNSGVYIQGDVDGTGQTIEHYVWPNRKIVLFRCEWFNPSHRVDVELETTLEHPQHILEEVSDDEIVNVEEEISKNEEKKSFDDEEWDDNENETIEEEEWENVIDLVSILELARLIGLKRRSLGDPYILRIFQDLFLLLQSASIMILIYLLFHLVWRILGHIILIIINQSVLSLLHMHSLHDTTRTYLYRLFVEHDPYRLVGYRMVLQLPHQSDAMTGMPPLTQCFVHPSVSFSSTVTPSATPDDETPALAPG
ncbi:hypothetical protein H5410_021955 [Solanum commersonii]|uniref:Transposase-associated domain-containing protein n=1 Tax=Solanum commersonii TaxID=4109 RepID=A0A9J5ZDF6_SOLCO|nr:hypothetical protein H5410_021955 [Solanum commersonii]